MPFKQPAKAPGNAMDLGNEVSYLAQVNTKLGDSDYGALLCLIASVLDDAGAGAGTWISIGKNRNGDAFLLTVHTFGEKLYAGGASLVEISGNCYDLLTGP